MHIRRPHHLLPLALLALPLPAAAEPISSADIAAIFKAHKVKGCLVLREVHSGRTVRHDAARAKRRMLPASTFKIPNALISVETGVIKDAEQVLAWDGKKRWARAWNRDQTLRSALQNSVVWAFQRMARQVGRARMQKWVDKLGYGNRDLSGPIDRFWLDGKLGISADEQVAFLGRLAGGKLPLSARTVKIVREALVVERGPSHVMLAKTGWAIRKKRQHGWYVGWVERGAKVWLFAMNMDGKFKENRKARLTISRAVLRRAGALPAARGVKKP